MSTIKRVTFQPEYDEVYEIESLDDFTEQEILDSYYSSIDLGRIAVRCFKEATNGTGYLRGLEKHSNKMTVNTIRRCIDSVMDEQEDQWEEGLDDYDRIAFASQEVSRVSVSLALEQAEQDEQEAQDTYLYTDQPNIRISMVDITKVLEEDELTAETSLCSDLSHFEMD